MRRYVFSSHISGIIFDVDVLARYAELGGWPSVVRDLEKVRHILEGIGAELSGHTLVLGGEETGEEAGE